MMIVQSFAFCGADRVVSAGQRAFKVRIHLRSRTTGCKFFSGGSRGRHMDSTGFCLE